MRAEIGGECAVATRIPLHGDSGVPGAETLPGIEIDDMLALVAMADDLVDLWDVTVGSWPEDSGTSRYYPEGHQRPWTQPNARGHGQADRGRRPLHQPGPDGAGDRAPARPT